MVSFGNRLKELREKQKITQSELAYIFGISSTTISRYEKGEITPKEEIIVKTAQFFKVSADFLLGLSSVPNTHEELNKVYDELNGKARKLDAIVELLNKE